MDDGGPCGLDPVVAQHGAHVIGSNLAEGGEGKGTRSNMLGPFRFLLLVTQPTARQPLGHSQPFSSSLLLPQLILLIIASKQSITHLTSTTPSQPVPDSLTSTTNNSTITLSNYSLDVHHVIRPQRRLDVDAVRLHPCRTLPTRPLPQHKNLVDTGCNADGGGHGRLLCQLQDEELGAVEREGDCGWQWGWC